MRPIGSASGIGAPLPPDRIGGDNFPRYIGDRLILDFHEGAGTTVQDLSGNGNDGTFGAGAAAPTWERNRLSFDGGDYINCRNDSSFDITDGITLSCDFESTIAQSGIAQDVIMKASTYGLTYDHALAVYTGVFIIRSGATWYGNLGLVSISANVKYSYIGTYNRVAVKTFLDAVEQVSDPATGAIDTSANNVYISRAGGEITGYISFIRINATAFSAMQVLQEYLWNKWNTN